MLVLSRQRDEAIRIGDEIVLRVVDIRGDKVRLGFEAPRNVKIHREEVYNKIKEQEAQVKEKSLYIRDPQEEDYEC
jgi:carbon storage regulator